MPIETRVTVVGLQAQYGSLMAAIELYLAKRLPPEQMAGLELVAPAGLVSAVAVLQLTRAFQEAFKGVAP